MEEIQRYQSRANRDSDGRLNWRKYVWLRKRNVRPSSKCADIRDATCAVDRAPCFASLESAESACARWLIAD